MKLFIITLSDGKGTDQEFCQFNASIAELVVNASNVGYRIRAIEEIPNNTWPLPFPLLTNSTVGEVERYRIPQSKLDADIFPKSE